MKIDLTGQKFGRLLVVERDNEKSTPQHSFYRCLCDCGNYKSIRIDHLRNGQTKSCGCLNAELSSERLNALVNKSDLAELFFGDLEVLRYYDSQKGYKRWLCKCHRCGNTTILSTKQLKDSLSCGCLKKDTMKNSMKEAVAECKELKTNVSLLKKTDANCNNKTTGIRGVCKLKNGYYSAYISFKGIRYQLKRSFDINECIKSRKEAEEMLHKDFLEWYENTKKENKL